jgi:Response regulator of the LytR/AlgR family
MVNYIVCEDNKKINNNVVKIIDSVMMKNHVSYKKFIYFDYDGEFMKIIDENIPNKIYILDIETPSASGIDVVRRIREVDLNSIIIFVTSHDELGYTILKEEFMFFAFISKFDSYEEKLTKAIKKAMKITGQNNVLNITEYGAVYNVPLADITYITRDSVDRKSIINTEYNTFKVGVPLIEIKEKLNKNFKQSHRACIVNMNRVRVIDRKNKCMTFDTGEMVYLMNEEFRKKAVVKREQ